MKPIAVIMAFVFMGVLGVIAGMNRKILKWLALVIAIPMAKWPSLAVMLFSEEYYRGSTRGMEVCLTYLLSFAILVALSVRRKGGKWIPDTGAFFFFLYWLFSLPSLANCHPAIELNYTGYMYAWYEIWKVPMMYMVYKAIRGYCRYTDDIDSVSYTHLTLPTSLRV